MNVGLPGTGIGGLFYLLSALLMPIREICLALNKGSRFSHKRLILTQCAIAIGILAGIWLTGWLLGAALVSSQKEAMLSQMPTAGFIHEDYPNLIKTTFVFLTLGLLMIILASVQILKLLIRHRRRRYTDQQLIKRSSQTRSAISAEYKGGPQTEASASSSQ